MNREATACLVSLRYSSASEGMPRAPVSLEAARALFRSWIRVYPKVSTTFLAVAFSLRAIPSCLRSLACVSNAPAMAEESMATRETLGHTTRL